MAKTAILSIRILSDARDAIKGLGEAEDKAGGFGKMLGGISPGALAVGGAVVTGVAAAGKALYDLGSVFDDVEDTIRVGTGATGEALQGLVDDAHAVATSVPTSFEAAGATVADLNTRLGLSGDTLQTVASQYLEAGRILGEDVDISATTAAFGAFHIEGEGVSTAMDDLFRVSQATGVGMNDLATSVQTNALALQEMGFSFEDSIALVGSLDKAGVDADATLTAMRKGMINLAQPGEDLTDAFSRVTGQLQGYIDAGDTAAALDLAGTVFGTRGAAQMVQALQTGTLSMGDLTAAAGVTGDTILGVGQDTQDAAEKWQILKNKGMEALEPLASAVFGLAGDALGGLVDWIDSVDWSPLTEGVAAVGDVAASFGQWIASLDLGALTGFFSGFGDAAGTVGTKLAGIGERIGPLIQTIQAGLGPVLEALAPVLASVFETGRALVQNFIDTAITVFGGFVDYLGGFFTLVRGLFTGDWSAVWEGAKQMVSGGIGVIRSVLSGLGGILSGLFSSAWAAARSAVSSGVSTVIGVIRGLPGQAASALGNIGSTLVNAGARLINGFIEGITSKISAVRDTLTGLTDKLTSWKGPEQRDATLLEGAGQLVIGGLIRGLESQYPAVRASLRGLTADIAHTPMGSLTAPVVSLDSARAGRGTGVYAPTYHVHIGPGADGEREARRFLDTIRRHERRHGRIEVAA
ncbi:phage tail tape measure protein [Actinomyces faecalis]|uniref:phage tail tape measure protein n=1 Tax=Actinomyces faecalis TaxID=2722820 RepID=UPI0015574D7C|nr:phage tail tape measure protein [Actinomyces faecalis]